ncbi:MAG TPA: hypothetical protein VKX46_02875, partial [Ktedonobacteraceae bacterium]|nr:hypothetical protein [Ktedonobacteraceae bacterium]
MPRVLLSVSTAASLAVLTLIVLATMQISAHAASGPVPTPTPIPSTLHNPYPDTGYPVPVTDSTGGGCSGTVYANSNGASVSYHGCLTEYI